MGKGKRACRLLSKSILAAITLSHCGCKEMLVKMPKELEKTGVEIGNGLFDKKVFLSDRGIGKESILVGGYGKILRYDLLR